MPPKEGNTTPSPGDVSSAGKTMHSFQDARVTIGTEFAAAAADSATVGGTVIRRPGHGRARLPSGWTQSISNSSRPQVCGNEMEEESLPSGEEGDESLRTCLGAAHRLPALQGDSSEFSQQGYHGVPFAEQFSLVEATRPTPTMGRQSGGWAGNSASNTARLCGTAAVGDFVPPVVPRQHFPSPLGQGYHPNHHQQPVQGTTTGASPAPTTTSSRAPGLNPRAPIYSATSGRLIPVEYPPVSSKAAKAQYRADAGGSLRMVRQRPAALQLNITAAHGYGQGQLPALVSRSNSGGLSTPPVDSPSSPLAVDAGLELSGSPGDPARSPSEASMASTPQVPATPSNTAVSASDEASEAAEPYSLVDEVTKEDCQHGVFINLPRDFDPWPRRVVVTQARTETQSTSTVVNSGSTSTVGSQRSYHDGTNGRSSGNETNCDTANTEYFSAMSVGFSSPRHSSIDATIDEESNVSDHMAALGDEVPIEATAHDIMFSTPPTFTISPEQPFFDALSHPTDSPRPLNHAEIGNWATLIQPDQTENDGITYSPQHCEVPCITVTEATRSIDSSHQSLNAQITGSSTLHPQLTGPHAHEASAVQQPVWEYLPWTQSAAILSSMFLSPEMAGMARYFPTSIEATFAHHPAISMSLPNPLRPAFTPSGLHPYNLVPNEMMGYTVPFIPPVAPQHGFRGTQGIYAMQGIQHVPANQSASSQQMHVIPHGNASRPIFISNSERIRAARLLYSQPRDWVFQPEMPQVSEMPQIIEMPRPQQMAIPPVVHAQPMPSFHQAGD